MLLLPLLLLLLDRLRKISAKHWNEIAGIQIHYYFFFMTWIMRDFFYFFLYIHILYILLFFNIRLIGFNSLKCTVLFFFFSFFLPAVEKFHMCVSQKKNFRNFYFFSILHNRQNVYSRKTIYNGSVYRERNGKYEILTTKKFFVYARIVE